MPVPSEVESPAKDFASDALRRQIFADRLLKLVAVLAETAVLPAGRVIGVDSPWGSGKTWIAERLPTHFASARGVGRCVYVNAFEFDFHTDPFAVLVSAILTECADLGEQTRDLRTAAGEVLKVGVPAVGKELARAGAKALGVDVEKLADALAESAGRLAEKAVDKLLDSFEAAKSSATGFKQRLAAVARASGGPVVIVIDELDRCRPSFALELLERVKHLFDVEGIVFVLFLHAPSLYSAISHTYGDVDSHAYLKKFISLWLSLPKSDQPNAGPRERFDFLSRFISARYPEPKTNETADFRRALCIFSHYFNASFRDIENAMLLGEIAKQAVSNFSHAAAYLILLRLSNAESYDALTTDLRRGSASEAGRLAVVEDDEDRSVQRFRDMFQFHADPDGYRALVANAAMAQRRSSEKDCVELLRYFLQTQASLKIEHLKL